MSILQLLATGVILAKLGEQKKGTYGGVDLFFWCVFSILYGIAFWKIFF
jgi:hypothetical protein